MNHAKIFSAYLGKLSLAASTGIFQANAAAWSEQLNGSASSQREAQNRLDAAVADGFNGLLPADLTQLGTLVEVESNARLRRERDELRKLVREARQILVASSLHKTLNKDFIVRTTDAALGRLKA